MWFFSNFFKRSLYSDCRKRHSPLKAHCRGISLQIPMFINNRPRLPWYSNSILSKTNSSNIFIPPRFCLNRCWSAWFSHPLQLYIRKQLKTRRKWFTRYSNLPLNWCPSLWILNTRNQTYPKGAKAPWKTLKKPSILSSSHILPQHPILFMKISCRTTSYNWCKAWNRRNSST